MKQIKRIALIAVLLITTLLQGQTKVFNSQVRIKQVPLSSSLDSLVAINSSGLLTYLPKSELATEAQTLSFSNGQLTISDANTLDLDSYYYSQTEVDGLVSSNSGALEFITEGGNTGIAIKGRNPDNYGDIGSGAIDFSFTNFASNNRGATGGRSVAFGENSIASGSRSTAFSNGIASGTRSTAFGNSTSSGNISASFGNGNNAKSYTEVVMGSYGTDYTPISTTDYNANDRLFSLGNGTDDANRNDALIVYKSGNAILDGELTADKFIGDGSSLTNVDAVTVDGKDINDFIPYGNAVVSNDWNSINKSGFYTNSTNLIDGLPDNVDGLSLLHINVDSNTAAQQAYRSGQTKSWIRRKASNVWQPWQELYHDGNFTPSVINDVLTLTPRTQPGSPTKGMVYYDSGTDLIRYYNGTTWLTL